MHASTCNAFDMHASTCTAFDMHASTCTAFDMHASTCTALICMLVLVLPLICMLVLVLPLCMLVLVPFLTIEFAGCLQINAFIYQKYKIVHRRALLTCKMKKKRIVQFSSDCVVS